MIDEARIRSENKWKSIYDLCQDLPSFPFQSFSDLVQAVNRQDYALRLDSTTARQLYPYLSQGHLAKWLNGWLLFGPALMCLASLGAAYFTANWTLLFGISIALICFMSYGVPKPFAAPFRDAGTLIMFFILGILILALATGQIVLAFLCATFVVPFVSVRFVYARCVSALYAVVIRSETMFLYLFQRGRCMLQDRKTGKRFSAADQVAAERRKEEINQLNEATSAAKH